MTEKLPPDERSVAVVGGGLAGLTTALAIGRTGRPTHLINPDGDRRDPRTTAMLGPTVEMLRSLSVWDAIEPHTASLRTMRIIDGTRRLLRAPTTTFDASEIGQTEFGFNVPNDVAVGAMRNAIAESNAITVHNARAKDINLETDAATIALADGSAIEVALVVGADGRDSIVRTAANIPVRRWSYPQTALVTTFSHELAHGDVSTEFHTEHGPATQVPLPGNRSSLVWVGEPHEVTRRAGLSATELSREIEECLAHTLGAVEVDGPIGTFPMIGQIAANYGGRRAMLVGEAAHAFPPIGAQGFNLTMRDVRDCVGVQRDAADPGEPALIEGYERMRAADARLRTAAVDALNRSLLSDLLPIQVAKAVGLGALKALPPLRQAVMRQGFRPTPVRSPSAILGDVLVGVRERAERARARRVNPAE